MTFDHRDAGTPETRWLAAEQMARLQDLDASTIRRLVVVAAHPDDETLGAGGLMQRVARAGGQVSLVVASDGEASHPSSPTHPPESLRSLRVAELARAVGALAPGTTITHLGLPDGRLKHHAEELRAGIEAAVGADTDGLTLAATWRGDGHGDHRAVAEAASAVAGAVGARLLEYPIWLWHWADPADADVPWASMQALVLDAGELEQKRQAMALHRSQTEPLSPEPGDETLLSEGFLQHFGRAVEVFVTSPGGGASLAREYFDEFYADRRDPWGFETRWYEQRKRAITMASLPRERFTRALEIGCSIGVLTEQLARHCDSLLATDIAEQPLRVAEERLSGHPQVTFRQMAAHEEWPGGEFDLIVLSEVGYYLSEEELARVIRRAAGSLSADGVLVACHWRHRVRDYPLTGDHIHEQIRAEPGLGRLVLHEEEDFVLELFGPPSLRSVAHETGLL